MHPILLTLYKRYDEQTATILSEQQRVAWLSRCPIPADSENLQWLSEHVAARCATVRQIQNFLKTI